MTTAKLGLLLLSATLALASCNTSGPRWVKQRQYTSGDCTMEVYKAGQYENQGTRKVCDLDGIHCALYRWNLFTGRWDFEKFTDGFGGFPDELLNRPDPNQCFPAALTAHDIGFPSPREIGEDIDTSGNGQPGQP